MLQEKDPRLCLSVSLLYKYACSEKIGRRFARILIVLMFCRFSAFTYTFCIAFRVRKRAIDIIF